MLTGVHYLLRADNFIFLVGRFELDAQCAPLPDSVIKIVSIPVVKSGSAVSQSRHACHH